MNGLRHFFQIMFQFQLHFTFTRLKFFAIELSNPLTLVAIQIHIKAEIVLDSL